MIRNSFRCAALLPATFSFLLSLCAGCGGSPQDPAAAMGEPNQELTSSSNRYFRDNRPPPIVRQLEEATAGLLFTSESDYPFEVLYWTRPGGALDAAHVAQLTGHSGETVEERSLDDFFRGATTLQEGATDADAATVDRYRALVGLLRAKLSFVRVYRFGHIQIHSYVVGVTGSGSWAGLATVQIET